MAKIISAGLLDTLIGLLGGAGKSLVGLTKSGVELGKVSEEKNIYKVPFKLKDGTTFTIKYKYLNEEHTLCKLMVLDEQNNQRVNARAKVDPSNPDVFMKEICDLLEDGWAITIEDIKEGDGTPDNPPSDTSDDYVVVDDTTTALVPASRTLNVTLQRVCSAAEDSINLVRVYGNYNEHEMQSNIETLLDNEGVLAQITEAPVSFEVTDDGDELDVNTVEMSETECIAVSLTNILSCAFKTLHNLQAIHWNAKGDKFEEIHRGSDSCIWNVRSQIDTLAELCVELTGSVPHPALLCSTDSSLNAQSGFEGQEALQLIHSDMSEYIYCLEFYLPNFKDDVQNMMNMWIRDMRHMIDYQLGRSVDSNSTSVPALI